MKTRRKLSRQSFLASVTGRGGAAQVMASDVDVGGAAEKPAGGGGKGNDADG